MSAIVRPVFCAASISSVVTDLPLVCTFPAISSRAFILLEKRFSILFVQQFVHNIFLIAIPAACCGNMTVSAKHTAISVRHVSEMVDRFVNSEAETQGFGLRIMSIGTPSWRAKAQKILHPVAVQSQGIQAWMLAKEDAAMLTADMHKRSDFREYNSPYLLVNNGQSTTVNTMQTRNYTNGIELHPEMAHPGFVPQQGHFDEGFPSSSIRCCRSTATRSTR